MDLSSYLDCSALREFIALQRGHPGPSCCGDCHSSDALVNGWVTDGPRYALCCRMVRWLEVYKPGWRDGDGL